METLWEDRWSDMSTSVLNKPTLFVFLTHTASGKHALKGKIKNKMFALHYSKHKEVIEKGCSCDHKRNVLNVTTHTHAWQSTSRYMTTCDKPHVFCCKH